MGTATKAYTIWVHNISKSRCHLGNLTLNYTPNVTITINSCKQLTRTTVIQNHFQWGDVATKMFHNYMAYRFWFSGLWHHVDWQAFTHVSEEPAVILGETAEHEAAGYSETLAIPSTRHDIRAQKLHGRVNLKSQTGNSLISGITVVHQTASH